MALENVGGRETFFGVLPAKNQFGAEKAGAGSVKELIFEVSFDSLPSIDAGNEMLASLPAGATVLAADFRVSIAWVGGDTLSFGTGETDGGGTPDVDSLITAVQGDVLLIDAVGNYIQGTATEAGIQAVIAPTERLSITGTTAGTFTAGEGLLKVQYIL